MQKSLVYSALIYAFALVFGMNFILANAAYGDLTPDFYLIALIVLLPLLFFLLYFERGRVEALYGRGPLLLKAIIITTAISAAFVAFFIIPFTY